VRGDAELLEDEIGAGPVEDHLLEPLVALDGAREGLDAFRTRVDLVT
jgi:hypothetical protein